jgi:hypothetical protein
MIPIPAALTAPHTTAVIPRMSRILAYFRIIFFTTPRLFRILCRDYVKENGLSRYYMFLLSKLTDCKVLRVISSEGRLRLLSKFGREPHFSSERLCNLADFRLQGPVGPIGTRNRRRTVRFFDLLLKVGIASLQLVEVYDLSEPETGECFIQHG